MYKPRPNSNSQALTNIEKILINDEILMRLLFYPPSKWDDEKQVMIPTPLDDSLPNVVDGSKKYWNIVKDKFRKGSKRMQIEHTKSAVLYMHEGRERPVFGHPYMHTKEVTFRIVINEDFEIDNRISDISERIGQLILHRNDIAGVSKLRLVGKNPREAPLGNRLQEDTYVYNILNVGGGDCGCN